MKVKLKQRDNQILLSIGMIVKNEEKHLENCMKALLPLRQQIKSELIIVDTGSTDRTIEIAKKNADKFYEFEWIDDFAAARNFGLEKATGKWFMFLDADEYFDEDIIEMVNFFRRPDLLEKYNSACYIIRNYFDDTLKDYVEFQGSRMVKLTPDVRFEGAIHETLEMKTPTLLFDTFVHHFGYHNNVIENKNKRNIGPLLEEYEKNPNDPRILSLLVDACEESDIEKYLKIWLECSKKNINEFTYLAYMRYINYLGANERYAEAEHLYNDYLRLPQIDDIIYSIEVYALMAIIYTINKKTENAYITFQKYFDMYHRYKKGKISTYALRFSTLRYISQIEYEKCVECANACLSEVGDMNKALKVINHSLNSNESSEENDDMKVNIKSKETVEENDILLSIGMIVKNEEKHLENCMKALLPLRQQIKSELIIVDTGSTDRSIEIAKKYADKFIEFEWCDDFAAARNSGLEQATGKWFMFLDADEYFDEDVSEIVNFFKYPELYNKYNSASYVIRNYDDETKKKYSDFFGSRMVRRTPEIKFSDPIHEYLPMNTPHGYFNTVVHHFGYVYKNNKARKAKNDRNYNLMIEEYNKDPKNARVLSHLISCCTHKDREKYFEEWLDICRDGKAGCYRNSCYAEYIRYSAWEKEYDRCEKLYEEYMKADNIDDAVTTVSINALMASMYYVQEKFEKALEFFNRYFKIFIRYKNNELNMMDLNSYIMYGVTPTAYMEYELCKIDCLFKLDMDEKTSELLDKLDVKTMDFPRYSQYSVIISKLADKPGRHKYIVDFYKKVIATGDSDKLDIITKLLEEFYAKNPDKRVALAKSLSVIDSDEKFISIMKIVAKESENEDISDDIAKLIGFIDNWKGGYSELIYLAIKHKVDMSPAIPKITYEQTIDFFKLIAYNYEEYAEKILEYVKTFDFTSSIKEMFWIVSALEVAVLTCVELEDEQKHELYDIFLLFLTDYVFNIYNPELFNENDVEIMPPLHRFGYYIGNAMMARNEGNQIAYIRLIKTALKDSEPMKDVVAYLLEEFEASLK